MATKRQLSFSGGEIAPALHARIDLTKYATGLKTCENWMVMRHGGVITRPGTGFVGEVKNSSKVGRLIPFIFNDDQTYALEFGDLYMRVIRDGAQELETAQNITGATQTDPCVITITAHGYSNGEEVYITDVGGMTELNVRNFKVANVTANTFELQEMDGTNLDATGYTAYTSGGTAARVYTITTPYLEADLATLEFIQSADIITITHPDYEPRELARSAHTTWTLTTITFGATIGTPQNPASDASGTAHYYKITAVDIETNEEGLPSDAVGSSTETSTISWEGVAGVGQYNIYKRLNGTYGWIGLSTAAPEDFTPKSVTLLTATFPIIPTIPPGFAEATVTAHGYSVDDTVLIEGADQEQYNGVKIITVVPGANTFRYSLFSEPLDSPATGTITVTATATAFIDASYDPDPLDTYPAVRLPFDGEDNFPSTCAYYQQRLVFANTNNDTEGVWTSRSTLPKNMMVSTPIQDDDAVTFSLLGREVNAVKHLLEVDGRLILFTSSGEWLIKGDTAGILTPSAINPDQQTGNGSGTLRPLVVDDTALYVQARGSVVRDIGYDFDSDGYRGSELSIFASHMFDNYTLADWSYQQIPHSIVWTVRSDGTLLGLTYVREHQVVGWHRHVFADATVENVCVIPGGNEDVLYLLIKRTINGKTVRYIEFMKTRQIDDIVDFVGMDSSLSYDGRHTGSITMTLTGGEGFILDGSTTLDGSATLGAEDNGWTYDSLLILTASSAFFTSDDVGNAIHLTSPDGTETIRCLITGYSSTTVVTVKPNRTVPVSMREVALTVWSKAIVQVTGLWHLEGENVSAFVDGYVSANPNNDAYTVRTVTNGVVTLDDPHAVIHIGLPITADLKTLPLDSLQAETLSDKKKHVSYLNMHVEDSMGLWVGPDEDHLTELKQRDLNNGLNNPIVLETGSVELNITSEWNDTGEVLMRQIDPVPGSILAITPAGFISG